MTKTQKKHTTRFGGVLTLAALGVVLGFGAGRVAFATGLECVTIRSPCAQTCTVPELQCPKMCISTVDCVCESSFGNCFCMTP